MVTPPPGLFRPFQRLVRITLLGTPFDVPENNVLLRGLQYLSLQTVSYGRFCWNEECQYCRVVVLGLDGREHKVLACKLLVRDGLEVRWIDEELRRAIAHLFAPD
jgi:hypothetical protein